MCGCHRNAAKQCAGRADVLAECRLSHAHIVCGSDWQHNHKQYQNDVFNIGKQFRQPAFARRDFVKQLLNQTKRANPAADKSAEQDTDCKQESDHVKAEIELHGAGDCLHGANGTGERGGRARVAVETGIAELLPFAGIKLPSGKISNMGVGKSKGGKLYQFSFDCVVHACHPNPMHSRQILAALFQTVSCSPRFMPHTIISAAASRNAHWRIVLFGVDSFILAALLSVFIFKIYGEFRLSL